MTDKNDTPRHSFQQDAAPDTQGAWFLREIDEKGKKTLVPANNMAALVGVVVLLGIIASGTGGMSLILAENAVPAVALFGVCALLIALAWHALTAKTKNVPAPKGK